MTLGWKLRRLRAMGAAEIAFRVGRSVRIAGERAGLGLARNRAPVMPAVESPPWFAVAPGGLSTAHYSAAADRILDGRMEVFAERDLAVAFPPRWNRDPKSGREVPLAFGKTLNYRDAAQVGDFKCLWEINRQLQLVTLAQAWRLTGQPRYAEACRELLESWFDQCPYPLGINWTSSLESAVRLVNWSASWHLLGGNESALFAGDRGASFKARWLQSVHQHCHFVAGHLSRHSSANNHLLGELLGLYAGATTWPLWPESSRWGAAAHREIATQALLQNSADGVNREQAAWYHHSVLELLLIAGLMAKAAGQQFSAAYWERIERMLEFLASIMDAGGHVRFDPDLNDSAYRPLLATGAVLFKRPEFKRKAGRFDDQSRWLLGTAGHDQYEKLPADGGALPVRRSFPEGGLYVLGDCFETEQEVRIVADAAPLGYLSIAAHGHADALSFTLSVGGSEVLIDPGTCTYQTAEGWRDYFRGTSAHNTIRIDGQDQSVAGGPFLWLRHATARCEASVSDAVNDRLSATHDGYSRLADPVIHRRTLHYDKSAAVLRVEDELVCAGTHRVEQFWHFAADCAVRLQGNRLLAHTSRHVIALELAEGATTSIAHGTRAPLSGWQSRRFGELTECHTLCATYRISGTWRAVTTISIRSAQ
jgi:Heparinase II/III-like protein/Heparinase II/III N-terminus